MDLANVEVKVEDQDQALLLLFSLPKGYESFVSTMLYGKTKITLEDVKASLNSKVFRKKVLEHHGGNGEGLVARGRLSEKGSRGRVIRISKGALVVMKGLLQNDIDLLETDKVEKHRLHTCSKAPKFLISNVAFDVPALVKHIEGTCPRKVEKLRRKVELGSKALISFGGCTILKLRKLGTSKESKDGLDLSDCTI
ncbi:hypothetical protein CRG98_039819 [Punica granatum]|uniref:Retrovirus-related Pol polyprotein from transposon TNT 1-94 n=1 Tax=Punica granatum TaxID=22663 RepID=A0A2I0I6Z7_PUNGR|nr:hypothetical protein CRG98_039819 [Punica granatum]